MDTQISQRVPAWRSVKPATALVFHNESLCWDGNNIEARYWREGEGDRRLCFTCEGLARKRGGVIAALRQKPK
jgi:hypothetical protein